MPTDAENREPALVERPIEWCRACRDEKARPVPADFLIWGKLIDREHLGPRCYEHTAEALGWQAMARIDQYAVLDLRRLTRLEPANV